MLLSITQYKRSQFLILVRKMVNNSISFGGSDGGDVVTARLKCNEGKLLLLIASTVSRPITLLFSFNN